MRGLNSEKQVIHYYHEKKYQLLKQRVKTPFAEVDLLFRSPQGHLVLVEVKSANLSSFYSARVSKNQKNRLLRAMSFLAAHFDCLVEIHFAFVGPHGNVTVFEDM